MKFHVKKPDIKGEYLKWKNMTKEERKAYRKEKKAKADAKIEARKNSALHKKLMPYYKVMNRFSLVMHVLLACMINFSIEAMSRHSVPAAWNYMVGSPLVFLYNAFMIAVTFSVVYLSRRRVFWRLIISVLWLILGISNGVMLAKRVTPLNAQDFKVATDAVSLINNYFSFVELVTVIGGLGVALLFLSILWRIGGLYEGKIYRVVGLGIIGACAICYSVVTNFAISERVVSTYFGNIAFAYQDYGLPYCFMASVFNTGIDEPNGYDKEAIDRITDNESMVEAKVAKKYRDEQLPNIIVVQLESYFDVEEAEFFKTSKDVSPNLRKMYNKYSSGYFKVPSVGAGTANTEFEVLTGMNLRYFGPGEYPYKTYLKKYQAESAASALENIGYGTHALHNNGGNFYSRAKVFNNIGFDTYTSKEFMNILQLTENGWAKDSILPQHILEAMDTTEGQDFIFTVSLQGHGEYPEEEIIDNPEVTVEGISDVAKKNKWLYYVNQVYEMDKFAGDLVDAIEKRGEPSVVVFYGDHLPTMGLKAEDLKSRYLYNTNYVIWDNIGLKERDKNIPAYQLMSEVFEQIGIHSGTLFNYHQQRHQTKGYLSDLELLQYDMLYGEQYVYAKSGLPVATPHMIMGVKDAELTEVAKRLLGSYSLYGKNFTQSSKVFVNGEKQKSNFLNNTRIDLTETELENGDEIFVAQMGSSNTMFRRSDTYIFEDGELVRQEGTGTDVTKAWTEQEEQ